MTASTVLPADAAPAGAAVDVVIIGAGAAGLSAALAARDSGASVQVLERDPVPAGNTALTLGMLPGAGTRFQREKGIADDPGLYAADILKKTHGETDPDLVHAVAAASAPAVEWLHDRHGVRFELLDDILYPGHARHRYHVPASRTGTELMEGLLRAARAAGVELATSAAVDTLYADPDGRVVAVAYQAAGQRQVVRAGAVVLACGGYGANPERIAAHMPAMARAVRFGHAGNTGDALAWGEALGAAMADLGGYQGHCVAAGPDLPLTWALIIRGGIQVNATGRRFSNEMRGYSEQAAEVEAQPGGFAWTIYDDRCAEPALTFADYHRVLESGVVLRADSAAALAAATGLPETALAETLAEVAASAAGTKPDRFGRDFTATPTLAPPFLAVRVRGALFHTQGGLAVDAGGQVRRAGGGLLPNLLAAGGAARGLSGPAADGYLGGNGLVSAVALGALAGARAAALCGHTHTKETPCPGFW